MLVFIYEDHGAVVPTKPNRSNLAKVFADSLRIICSDAGQASVFQFQDVFIERPISFLDRNIARLNLNRDPLWSQILPDKGGADGILVVILQ